VLAGDVTINRNVCQNLATEVSEADFVKEGSRRIVPEKPMYILLHKPRGYLCTASDTHERRTIFDLLPGTWPRLFHVGRLDRESEGLLILTNDGELGLHLTHPRFKIEKEYEVLLDRPYDGADTPRLLRGVSIEGGRAKADAVRQLSPTLLRIVLRQGLKRQIRLMLYKVGYEVKRLIRMRIGPLRLTELRAGEWRALTPAEVKGLRAASPGEEKGDVKGRRAAAGRKDRAGRSAEPGGRREGARPRGAGRRRSDRTGINGRGSAASTPKAGWRP
jgi:23S rRNA pseudouridine2605 synthase